MISMSARVISKLFLPALLLDVSGQFQARPLTEPPRKLHRTSLLSLARATDGAPNVNYEPVPLSSRPSAGNQPLQDGTQDKSKADAAFEQGEGLRKEGSAKSLKKAIEKYEEALLLYRAVASHSGEAKTLNTIGFVYDALGERRKALDYYNKLLPIHKALGDRQGEGRTLNSIGAVYDLLGEKQKALEFYNLALPTNQAAGDRDGEAITLNNIGFVYHSFGDSQKALEFYNQALPIRRALRDRAGEATTLNNIGGAYEVVGEGQKALECYDQALTIYKVLNDRRGEAGALNNIGAVYDSLGEKQKALKFFNLALPIREAVGDPVGKATTLNNIGFVYHSLGFDQAALEYYNKALRIYRAVGDRSNEAGTLNNIGTVFFGGWWSWKTFSVVTEVRAPNNSGSGYFGERRQTTDPFNQARTVNEFRTQYHTRGNTRKALKFYLEALPLRRAVGDRVGEAITLSSIGSVYAALGERQKALEFYNQALPIYRGVGYRAGESTMLHNLMVFWRSDNASLAIFYGKQAVNALQQLRANITGLEKELQKTFLRSKEETYRDLAGLLIVEGRLAEAQQVLGLLKEEEYFEFVRRDAEASLTAARISFTSAEAELEKRFSEITDRIAEIGAQRSGLLAIRQRNPEQEKQLSELEAQLQISNQAFQKFLDQLQADLRNTPRGGRDVVIVQESQALKDTLRKLDAIALYTIISQEKYSLILITPDVEKAFEYKISEAELNRKIFAFRQVLQNPASNPLPLSQELYRILIGPELARDIAQTGKQTLVWSLDGALRYLPIAALHDGKKYLVESYRNVMITLASRDRLKDPVSSKWQALGLGVSKSAAVTTGSTGSERFPPLPGVRDELAGIIRDEKRGGEQTGVLPGTVLLDEGFTAEAMKSALRLRGNEQSFKLVHIASHFRFEPGDETKSFLLMGGGKTLTLAELKSMIQIFSRVELLTLSACNTATGGEANGKEVEGFAVLAQRQGAEAIIASLWPVSDMSTSQLMRHLYRLRDEHPGMSKAEAMRLAQLALLHGEIQDVSTDGKKLSDRPPFKADPKALYAHPYFWAPFILIGNWR